MSSSDVRDVLNLPDGATASGGRPSKKARLSAPRPNLKGLAREVQNLGGDNPIAIVPEVSSFKKKRLANRKPAAKWELAPFRNSAREDQTLVLRHWRRKKGPQGQEQPGSGQDASQPPEEGSAGVKSEEKGDGSEPPAAQEIEDSAFAKFNVKVNIPTYSDDQYKQYLTSEEWSKEETDYLMEVVTDFELRWPLIWDRYEWNPPATNGEANADGDESKAIVPTTQARTMEDLKARYYEVAAKVMAIQKPVQYMSQQEFAHHEIMAKFDPEKEKARKDFARNALNRSKEEAREEESLLLEVKRILARSERFNEERRELYHRLDYPHAEQDINQFKTSAGLQALLNNLVQTDKAKKRRSLMGPEGQGAPANPAAAQAAAQESSRRESVSSAAPAAPAPASNNKKGQQQQQLERPKLTEKEEAIYGVVHFERLGSGPVFRSEKINKLFSHKSNQQQQRIYNTLNELDVPQKLAMPTAGTTSQYEQLLAAVNTLLDARKVTDKLDGELKVEEARHQGLDAKLNPQPDNQDDKETTEEEKAASTEEQAAEGDGDAAAPDAADDAPETAEAKVEDGEPEAGAEEDNKDEAQEEEEDKGERPKSSGGANKRSASVLSATSDKSSKRQKK